MQKQLIALGTFLVLALGALPSMAFCPCKQACPAATPCCPAAPVVICPAAKPCCPTVKPCCPAVKPCCPAPCEAMPCPAAPIEDQCEEKTNNDCCD